jgi:hypothetical protein
MYKIAVGLFGESDKDVIKYLPDAGRFEIFMNKAEKQNRWQGIVDIKTEWK